MSTPSRFTVYSTLFAIAILLGMFFRVYQPLLRLTYGHDSDLASWIIKDIVLDGHPRLIGQLTTQPGVFIGSFSYYSQIPGYFLAHFDPAGNLLWSWIVSAASLISIFWVSYKLYGKKTAVVTTLLFAVSFDIARTERIAVPTALAFTWLTWFYYFLHRLFSGYTKSLYGLAILFALVWHINLALGLLFPLAVMGIVMNLKKLELRHLAGSLFLGVILLSPLLIFETRHNFQQFQAIAASGHKSFSWDNLKHTLEYAARNMNETYWDRPPGKFVWILPGLFLTSLIYLFQKKVFSKSWVMVLTIWSILLLGFFTFSSINLSEYYLHGLNIIWIMTFGIAVSRLPVKISSILVLVVIAINLYRLFIAVPNHNGYVERKQLVTYIAKDALSHGYPCVAVSYITDPGNNLGYRYLFYQAGLHVNLPSSNSPVYTIVFPHSMVNHIDKSFGSLGLIYPNYASYNSVDIAKSCSGQDPNLTGDMFGFTK